ncbi:MAG: MFS family permease [Mariniblastus sp.]
MADKESAKASHRNVNGRRNLRMLRLMNRKLSQAHPLVQAETNSMPTSNSPSPKTDGRLMTKGFFSLLGVSFFGAANDNILKQVLVFMVAAGGVWENRLGAGSIGTVSLVLTIPFIFLSGYAGQIADKFSKRNVILWVKIAEIPIAIIALCGLFFGSFWLSLLALFLLAVQSSFYGPAKFGIIPEIVESNRLSHANGMINALSNIAIILGSLIAGPLADLYYPLIKESELAVAVGSVDGTAGPESITTPNATDANDVLEPVMVPDPSREPQRLPVGLVLVGVSIVGVLMALRMPKMKAVNPDLKFSSDFLGPHIRTFKDANRPLLVVMFSWSGFYLIGQLALMILAGLTEPLGVSYKAMSLLIGLLAISIGIGSCTVAYLSGKTIRPYFSLLGAIGMTISFAVMGLAPLNYTLLGVLVFLVGIFAGFYIVPLQALLQYLSPSDERGRFFGTANALSFVFISAASLIFIVISQLGMPVVKMPLVCAALAGVGTFVGMIELNRITAAQSEADEPNSETTDAKESTEK